MTQFNPDNKEVLTYGECLDPAMKIMEQEDADQYMAAYITFIQSWLDKEPSDKTAEQIAKTNLGYYAGYGSNELRQRVESLFHCSHPVFGSIVNNGTPTAQEAFDAGVRVGTNSKLNP